MRTVAAVRLVIMLLLAAAMLAASSLRVSAQPPADSSPALTPEQVEADWLHTDAVRAASAATTGALPAIKPEEDAAGGCDGVINGKWGFHTQLEDNPWWQIDLGASVAIERMVLYNRTELAERNSRIKVLLSDDGQNFRQAYQHDGTVFYGFSDQKPGVIKLNDKARYVRLQLPGTNYFHLDEVEIYGPGSPENVARGKPATQSSVSQWSVCHSAAVAELPAPPVAQAIERGLKLAEKLRQLGVNVDAEVTTLHQVAEQVAGSLRVPSAAPRSLYLQARWAVRNMALRNPLLSFDKILFVKRAPGLFPHMSDQFYGWWSRPGGGIYVLEGFKTDSPRLRCLTADMPPGNFLSPDMSHDGRKVLFAYCRHYPQIAAMEKAGKTNLPEDSFYHLFEMNADGTDRRQLTFGRYDDFDSRYLPDGHIVFLSTRKGLAFQTGKASAEATCGGDLPDSYVRCGGDNFRPVPVFTLHAMGPDGKDLRAISAFENFEWTPSVAADGRVLYARWDYIDRFNGHFESLWSTNPDGTNAQLVYGNFTVKPQCVFQARSIPGSQRLIFTAVPHHSITGGSLVLLDRTMGTEESRPLMRITPEVCFPETEGWPECYYADPYPLSEDLYLVAFSDKRFPPHCQVSDENQNPSNAMGIYLYDSFGNLELLHRDPTITSQYPLPVAPRPYPPVLSSVVNWDGPQEGRFLLQDVYQGMPGLMRGTIKRLRIVAVPPKVQPHMNNPNLGVSAEDPGKFILGTVPVEADGSAFFRVPSGMPVMFQALDADGLMVQTMRTLVYVQPNQTSACIGCHEHRDTAPLPTRLPLAAMREPSKIALAPGGCWPLKFEVLVQPVLDQHCTSCHKPDSGNEKAAPLDLTAANAYQSLLTFGGEDLKHLAFERDRSIVGDCVARKSKLYALLTHPDGHEGVKLDASTMNRLVTWMDTYAQRQGSFSPQQEEELRQLRAKLAGLLDETP